MKKYKIELTEKQMLELEKACEAIARLTNGQMFPMKDMCELGWDKCVRKPKGLEVCGREWYDMRDEVERSLNRLHTLCWNLPPTANYGLHHDPNADILWDMYQVFRHQRYLDMPEESREEMKWTVMADTPIVTGKEPLCKILSVKETEISNDYEDQ